MRNKISAKDNRIYDTRPTFNSNLAGVSLFLCRENEVQIQK